MRSKYLTLRIPRNLLHTVDGRPDGSLVVPDWLQYVTASQDRSADRTRRWRKRRDAVTSSPPSLPPASPGPLSPPLLLSPPEKHGRPIARGKPSLGPPSAESPVWMGRIWEALPTLPLLYRPDLCDWGWWAQIHLAYPLDNGKIDIVNELKKMQVYYATNEAKRPKKNWKNATRKWINNAVLGPSWMQPGASDRDRFFREMGT